MLFMKLSKYWGCLRRNFSYEVAGAMKEALPGLPPVELLAVFMRPKTPPRECEPALRPELSGAFYLTRLLKLPYPSVSYADSFIRSSSLCSCTFFSNKT